jgi:anaerobic magnesium-protoporphyrin IX monomethyl ester cyclase
MRVLLVNPPQTFNQKSIPLIGLPLGLLYIASYLEKKGIDVSVFDSLTCKRRLDRRKIADNIHLGASYEEVRRAIVSVRPDVIGISNLFSSQRENAIIVARLAKQSLPGAKVVVGGPHASSFPEDFLLTGCVDYVIRGEGERAMYELVRELSANASKPRLERVKNLSFVRDSRTISNPIEVIAELDELPFPAYHKINMANYLELMGREMSRISLVKTSERNAAIITSRGCPFNCVFCSISGHMGKIWRPHSPEYVLEHILLLNRRYGIDHISFDDDNLLMDVERFKRILEGIEKSGIRLSWDTPNGVRADRLSIGLLRKMKRTGCISLKIGIESGDQEILDKVVDKSLSLTTAVKAARMCQRVGIPLTGFFVIGMPGETKESIRQTLDFALHLKRRYDLDSVVNIARPLVGSRMYEIAKAHNYLVEGINPTEFSGKRQLMIRTEEFDPGFAIEELMRFGRKLLVLELLWLARKPSKILRYLVQLRNPGKFVQMLKFIKLYMRF